MTDKEFLLQVVKELAEVTELHKQSFTKLTQILSKISLELQDGVFPIKTDKTETPVKPAEPPRKYVAPEERKGTYEVLPDIPMPSKSEIEKHTLDWTKGSN